MECRGESGVPIKITLALFMKKKHYGVSFGGLHCTGNKLENIEEENATNWLPISCHKPETPTESMEFLARSWSLSAKELSKALCNTHADELPLSSRAGNQDQPSLTAESPPESPRGSDDSKELFLLHQALNPEFLSNQQLLRNGQLYRSIMKRKTMGRWIKDQKEKKKREMRAHNAQLHAAVSVAGVAAAVAALTAGSGTSPATKNKKVPEASPAIASAAALVASHCIEMAEHMGADHDQILSVVNSAINARTNGDVMTLTAAAATALRGASMLRARLYKEHGGSSVDLNDGNIWNGKEQKASVAVSFVSKGGELLKRTRKGDLHWKQVSFNINSNLQVVAKLKSKHMGGTFTKKKKCIVTGIHSEIIAWPGREADSGSEQRAYFAIQTDERIIEFECRSKGDQNMWVEGIHHTLHLHANN